MIKNTRSPAKELRPTSSYRKYMARKNWKGPDQIVLRKGTTSRNLEASTAIRLVISPVVKFFLAAAEMVKVFL
jgi:hypothetical protein